MCLIRLKISFVGEKKEDSPGSLPQFDFHCRQSCGGVEIMAPAFYIVCAGTCEQMFGKKAKRADYLPFSSSASIPVLLLSHTLDLIHSIDVVFPGEVLGCKREQEL